EAWVARQHERDRQDREREELARARRQRSTEVVDPAPARPVPRESSQEPSSSPGWAPDPGREGMG
ncbi:hypothetical protein KZO25_11745, partial [Halomonas sp. ANAO-440]|uniref:hypothetical protein n=1 Tax=Halomonas sp. ANAO-440 TaxID=2861360 RepID=UPI001CAA76A0